MQHLGKSTLGFAVHRISLKVSIIKFCAKRRPIRAAFAG
jgi:hypothetical protein